MCLKPSTPAYVYDVIQIQIESSWYDMLHISVMRTSIPVMIHILLIIDCGIVRCCPLENLYYSLSLIILKRYSHGI